MLTFSRHIKDIKWEKQGEDHTSVWLVLTNDVSPRDSQDDKILPKHPKQHNPKEKSYKLWKLQKVKYLRNLCDPFNIEKKGYECV